MQKGEQKEKRKKKRKRKRKRSTWPQTSSQMSSVFLEEEYPSDMINTLFVVYWRRLQSPLSQWPKFRSSRPRSTPRRTKGRNFEPKFRTEIRQSNPFKTQRSSGFCLSLSLSLPLCLYEEWRTCNVNYSRLVVFLSLTG